MRVSYERERSFERRAREAGTLAPRFAALLTCYAGVVALYCDEPIPLWVVAVGAFGGFVILLSYLLTLVQVYRPPAVAGPREKPLLDRIPGWSRIDDVTLSTAGHGACFETDGTSVVATPQSLLLIHATCEAGELAGITAAAAARRVRRLLSAPPNAIDVPVSAALLVGGTAASLQTGWDDGLGVYVLDADRPWAWPSELVDAEATAVRRPAIDEALRKVAGWAEHHVRRLSLRRLALLMLLEVGRGLADRRPLIPRRIVPTGEPLVTA
jgi:hypothetical protein